MTAVGDADDADLVMLAVVRGECQGHGAFGQPVGSQDDTVRATVGNQVRLVKGAAGANDAVVVDAVLDTVAVERRFGFLGAVDAVGDQLAVDQLEIRCRTADSRQIASTGFSWRMA